MTDEEYKQCAKIIVDFFEMAGALVPADALPFLRWFDIRGYEKKMKRVAKQVDQLAQSWLEEHKNGSRGSKEKQDFMDVLLGIYELAQEMSSEFEPDTIIKATCMQIILAAADTTAVTLTWTVSLLLNNKDVLKKAQAEVDAMVGKERLVDESDLKNLVYLQSVLKESMRLYPAGPLSVPRESTADCIVSGYHIPAGTQLFVNLYKIHSTQRPTGVGTPPLSSILKGFSQVATRTMILEGKIIITNICHSELVGGSVLVYLLPKW